MLELESKFTPPTLWCKTPELWHVDSDDPEGCETEVAQLIWALIRATQPEYVVETGTAFGLTANRIGDALALNGHGHLWTLEIDAAAAAQAEERCAGLPVTVVTTDSTTWWPQQPIDFAWIDSGAAQVRCAEVSRWRRMFRDGAIVAVHDTAPTCGRHHTKDGMEAVFAGLGWPVLNLRTPRGVMIAQVRL